MTKNRHYFRDRTALLLVSTGLFLTLANIVLIGLKMTATRGTTSYIVAYRSNLGLDRYVSGTFWDILSFVVAALLIFGFSVVLSYRVYGIKRELSIGILTLSAFLLVLLMVVSNALLVLR